jgi:hypothetical protein
MNKPKLLFNLFAMMLVLLGCKDPVDEIIPDDYEGWLVIQYDCVGGKPLDRQGDTIKVMFDQNGLFCTSDSSFSWHGQEIAKNYSGTKIRITGQPTAEGTGYGICCGQGFSVAYAGLPASNVDLDLLWVGDMQAGNPQLDIDAIKEDSRDGKLVPADW